jgi:hypothetical protein
MAEIIPADQLAVGDVYRPVALGAIVRAQAFAVAEIRTYVAGATYQVLRAINTATGNAASIELRADIPVARLEVQSVADLKGYLDVMGNGDQLNVVRYDDKFWC